MICYLARTQRAVTATSSLTWPDLPISHTAVTNKTWYCSCLPATENWHHTLLQIQTKIFTDYLILVTKFWLRIKRREPREKLMKFYLKKYFSEYVFHFVSVLSLSVNNRECDKTLSCSTVRLLNQTCIEISKTFWPRAETLIPYIADYIAGFKQSKFSANYILNFIW